MRSVNGESTQETIGVKIVQMGADTFVVRIPTDSTVQDAFDAAGLNFPAGSVLVDGQDAGADDMLDDGDIINVVGKKDGGLK